MIGEVFDRGTLPVGGWSPRKQITHLNDALLRTLDLPEQEKFRFAGAERNAGGGISDSAAELR